MTNVLSSTRRVAVSLVLSLALVATTVGVGTSADATPSHPKAKPTVVLLHGAWADASSWAPVTERLQKAGFDVRVPANNLRGPQTDAADLASYLGTIDGPIILAAHSYGGFVATNAAAGNPMVRGLVYVDAFIPAAGETIGAMNHPPSVFAVDPTTVFDFVPFTNSPAGAVDLYVKATRFGDAFAKHGIGRAEIQRLAASQRPLSTQAFVQPSGPPAWQTTRSWAVVGLEDKIIPVADQLAWAQRAGASITKVHAPHLSMLTNPEVITDVILRAARTV